MKTNLEIEYKTLLTIEEFTRIKKHFPFSEPFSQTNVYFDSKNRILFASGVMCRVRIIGENFEFTLKIPKEEGVLELELELDALDLNDHRVDEILRDYGIGSIDLKEIARSTTQRHTFDDEFGQWCLDYSKFSEGEDYEIEYELHKENKKAYPHYVDTLESLSIVPKKAEPKYIRALYSGQKD